MKMPPLADSMQVDETPASDRSPSSLSSPPSTPHNHDTIRVAHPNFGDVPQFSAGREGVANRSGAPAHASTSAHATQATNGNLPTHANLASHDQTADKPKRQRKKKDLGPDGKPIVDPHKKPRKPREPRVKTDSTASSAIAPARKRLKVEDKPAHDPPAHSRQPTLTELVHGYQQPTPSTITTSVPSQAQHHNAAPPPQSNAPTPRPASSGQRYDPVRGFDPVRASTMETSQQDRQPLSILLSGGQSSHTSTNIPKASASPSIASLIDPPTFPSKPASTLPSAHAAQTNLQQPQSFTSSQPLSPTPAKTSPATIAPASQPHAMTTTDSPAVHPTPAALDANSAMEIDPARAEVKTTGPQDIEVVISNAPSSSVPTPKAARPTPPPIKGTGSGLLSKSDLFGGPSANDDDDENKGITIDIKVSLDPTGNNIINIAQEVAKKYGNDALNPRVAAHRNQMRKLLAEAGMHDGGSADDMSVDLMSEAGDDSNVEMGGMDDERSGTGANGQPVRRRRKKIEEYDKEDDFIDDTELAWQEQAAVTKDGFFVYSGPLVPEGTTANVESSASSGRGGRGRGRGSRGGRNTAAASGTTHATLAADKSKDVAGSGTSATSGTRGRGRGRGTGAPRKPRITKAEKEKLEAEKLERERTAATVVANGTAVQHNQQVTSQLSPPRTGGGPTGKSPMPLTQQAPMHPMASLAAATPQHGYGGPQGTVV